MLAITSSSYFIDNLELYTSDKNMDAVSKEFCGSNCPR
jgi:hypothetical protein